METDVPQSPSATEGHAGGRNDVIAAAFDRRLQQQREALSTQTEAFDANHERRQAFRRMVDPGILRPNAYDLAVEALQTLKTLAQNILEHPGEAKYQRFKPTNSKIKKALVEPKGTLEYAVEMGFKPEVEEFQPFYVFDHRRLDDLQIGLDIINEFLTRESSKQERDERAKRAAKEAQAAEKEKLKRQFLDDRKSIALRNQREREARDAVAAMRAAPPQGSESSPISSPAPQSPPRPTEPTRIRRTRRSTRTMTGAGRTLNGDVIPPPNASHAIDGDDDFAPPPYEDDEEDDED